MTAPTTLTPRQQTGLQASWQSEALLRVLLTAAHSTDPEELANLVQALAPRLLQLNSVAMSSHNPKDCDTVQSMREELHSGYAHLVQQPSTSSAPTSPCTGCPDNFPLPTGAMDIFDQWAVQDQMARRTACTLRPAASKPCLVKKGGAA